MCTLFSDSGRSTPISGRNTPFPGKKLRQSDTISTTVLKSEVPTLDQILVALRNEKQKDHAQSFGDFIVSSIRRLPTEEKQEELIQVLNRALLEFQDKQSQYKPQPQPQTQTQTQPQPQFQAQLLSQLQSQLQPQSQYQESNYMWSMPTTMMSSGSNLHPISTISPNLNTQTTNPQNDPQDYPNF